MRAAPGLDALERWMQAVVMHPEGAAAGLRSRPAKALVADAARDARAVVLPSKRLGSVERLDIYAHMYYARLVEVMENEYPTVRRILGPREFAAACRRFVAKHPSRSRTLNSLSERFPDFLARSLPRSNRNGLAADVARIERAMEDVFDAARAEPMTAEQFAAIGADQWEQATLRLNPALRLLKLRYPANDYIQAVRAGRKPRVPRPRATWAIVFRRGYQVFRRDQEPEQYKLLAALTAGKTLGAAVRASIGRRSGGADRVAKRLGKWFEEWSAAQLFTGVEISKGDSHF